MQRRVPRIIFVLPLGLVAVVLLTWQVLAFLNRGPLAGEIKHDFGAVVVKDGPAQLSHTFHLRNRSSKALMIQAARPDCGCVKMEATLPMTVEGGGGVDFPITMHFTGANGPKKVLIRLDCGEAGVQNLWVMAAPAK